VRAAGVNFADTMAGRRLWDHAGTLKPWIDPLTAMLDDGTIQPVVAEAVPFDRALEAHRILAERRNVGKVVLTQ